MKSNMYVSQHNPNNQQVPHRQILGKQEFITELKEGRKNFPGVDLSGLRLANIDSDFDLNGCNFSGANLRECIITDCELDGTDFSGADLRNAELRGCTGIGTMMDATFLENALFEECNLYSSSFENARLANAKMSGCIFMRSNFVRADLSSIVFKNCNFEETGFLFASAGKKGEIRDCEFRDVSWQLTSPRLLFWNSDFQNVDFSGCDLGNSEFVSCKFRAPIVLERCRGLDEFVDTTFEGVNFLPLVNMPATWKKARGYEQQRAHYEQHKTQWDDIVKWRLPMDGQPKLSIDLYAYLLHISKLDALTRKCLREIATTQMLQGGPGVETDRARALFWKIMQIDDALTTSEDTEIKGRPARSLEVAWLDGGTKEVFLVPARAESWSVDANPSSGTGNDAKFSALFG